ncbi:MAG: aminoacyl-tRNA hydrolase, partial [Rickettsiella sp.]|nr:aminoacyl-tRNA hydrolase [Rickettsiella sp.]
MSISQPIQLIAGLANPGQEYAKSRHNAGAWLITAFAAKESLNLKTEAKFYGATAKLTVGGNKCWLLIPTTYMNNSGRSIRALANFYHIPTAAILIVHDDLDLPPGIARFKQGGGDGGHNGLKDMVIQLGCKDFWRLRIGIGHPGHRDRVHDYVLSSPSASDREKIENTIDQVLTI